MSSLRVTLPWPPSALSGNGRKHWRALAEIKRGAKNTGWALTAEVLNVYASPFTRADALEMHVTYCPPDRRRRDLFDNLPQASKAQVDGMCDALGVDDSQIRRVVLEWGEVVDGGEMRVTVERRP